MPVCVSRSSPATKKFASELIRRLISTGRRPIILALSGNLGSGKTTFIQGLALGLGISRKVQSPTFVIMKQYDLRRRARPFRQLVHIDAFRLKLGEARHLGLSRLLRDGDSVIVIEWAERIRKLIPKGTIWVQFKHGRRPQERILQILNFSGLAPGEPRAG